MQNNRLPQLLNVLKFLTFMIFSHIVTFTFLTILLVHVRSTTVTSIKITSCNIISIITYSIPSKLRFLTFWKYLWNLEKSTQWHFDVFHLVFCFSYQHYFFSIISTYHLLICKKFLLAVHCNISAFVEFLKSKIFGQEST